MTKAATKTIDLWLEEIIEEKDDDFEIVESAPDEPVEARRPRSGGSLLRSLTARLLFREPSDTSR